MDKVRIGIIGTSRYSEVLLLPVLSSIERADLTAICGRNQERARELAAKYSIPQVYADYRQMIDAANLEAIMVSSPDDLHYEMVMYALDAGLHVLCDKPMANNADHARQMLDKAEAAGIKHMVMHTWRWLPQMRYVKQLLNDGFLGRVYQARFRFSFGFLHKRDYAWRIDANRANGALGDMGSHMIDMARWFLGDIANVSASLKSYVQHDGPDGGPLNQANDSAFVLLDFASGAQGCLELSVINHLADEGGISVSLYGEKGSLYADHFYDQISYSLRASRRDEKHFERLEVPSDLLGGFLVDDQFAAYQTDSIGPRLFVECILDDKPTEPNFYDGFKTMQVIDAALESQRTGRHVRL